MAKKKQPESSGTHTPEPAPPRFLNSFSHFIRLDFQCRHDPGDDKARLIRWFRLTLITFCVIITRRVPGLKLVLWPRLFVIADEEAELSSAAGQHRGTFLIGIQCPESRRSRCHGLLRIAIEAYCSWVERKGIWTDELVKPLLEVRLAEQRQLGNLTEDRHMWPQKHAKALAFKYGAILTDPKTAEEISILSLPLQPAPEQPPSDPAKFPPAFDVLKRLKWDPEYNIDDFIVVYEDRFAGFQEQPAACWDTESTSEVFVPQHRIRSFVRKSTREVIWHRTLKFSVL